MRPNTKNAITEVRYWASQDFGVSFEELSDTQKWALQSLIHRGEVVKSHCGSWSGRVYYKLARSIRQHKRRA